jgi:hypothetical protein
MPPAQVAAQLLPKAGIIKYRNSSWMDSGPDML